MRIGILGVGEIGAILTQRLSAAGHEVKAANSRGPETVPVEAFSAGGRAVYARDTVTDVDALIISLPFGRNPDIADLIATLPPEAALLDTSNYYPQRDGHIEAVDNGLVESLWVRDCFGGRPLVKAWNAISADSFTNKTAAAGGLDRVAVPVAADSAADRALGISLVEDSGLEGFDAGPLSESWRQQPGSPSYCTDLTRDELEAALAAADAERSPRRRDLLVTVMTELIGDTEPSKRAERRAEIIVPLQQLMYN